MASPADRTIESLWDRMHVRLCRFIRNRVPDGQDAEDILQEVFLRAQARLHTLRDPDRLESWIYQVARNAIIDDYRERRRLAPLTDLSAESGDPQADDGAEVGPYLRQLVSALPEPYRQALILADIEGLSQQELADRIGISLSGAKSRLQRARKKIRAALLACCRAAFEARGAPTRLQPRCCWQSSHQS